MHGVYTAVKQLSLPNYLSIVKKRILRFISFARLFVPYKMQTTSPRIWTQFVVSIYNDDYRYALSSSSL